MMKGIEMKRVSSLPQISACILLILMAGCEIGTNPVILDGSPVSVNLSVNQLTAFFGDSTSVSLSKVLAGLDNEVDSIRLFNITLVIDSTTGMAPDTKLSGLFMLRTNNSGSDTLITMNSTDIRSFATERSIFDPKLADSGFTYRSTAILTLHDLLRQTPQPTVFIAFGGVGSTAPLHFAAHLKLYTQVFTTIQN